jgi:hypothetical protein
VWVQNQKSAAGFTAAFGAQFDCCGLSPGKKNITLNYRCLEKRTLNENDTGDRCRPHAHLMKVSQLQMMILLLFLSKRLKEGEVYFHRGWLLVANNV